MTLSHALTSSTPLLLNAAILVLRVSFGVCFIVHGLGKLGLVGTGNMAGFTGWLKSLGVPAPAFQARLAMLSEVVGGTLLVIGLGTRVAAGFIFITMLVAATLGHKGAGYLITNSPPGNEYALNLAILMIVLTMVGPGIYSLDHFLFAAR